MFSFLDSLLQKISLLHFNVLLLLGIALMGAILGSRFFKKIKIPQVVGYILLGIILGRSGFQFITNELVTVLEPFNYFALGLIGFMIGGELKFDVLKKYGKQFVYILLFEGIGAFVIVAFCVFFAGRLFFDDINFVIALSLVLGAIASATAPAATTDVLWENRSKGPLTSTVLGIVAMDDALALFLFAIASMIAMKLIGTNTGSVLLTILHPVYEIGGAILLGGLSGLFVSSSIKNHREKDKMLPFSLGVVLIVIGLSLTIKVDMLMSAMVLGIVIVNRIPRMSKELFSLINGFTPPIYILFFVLVGAKLKLSNISSVVGILILAYFLGRTAGKMVGSFLGAYISGAPKTVQKYLPLCLFSQAGVAIGLSIVASHIFPEQLGNMIVVIVTTTTFIVQIIGPVCTRIAIHKATEAGLDLTEEDILKTTSVSDIITEPSPVIFANQSLKEIVQLFTTTSCFQYPVVTKDYVLCGIISVRHIKHLILEEDPHQIILAHDIMEEAKVRMIDSSLLVDVLDTLKTKHLPYLAIVNEKENIVGIVHLNDIDRFVSTKLMALHSVA
ncbi:MAG: cation:proton antiporter [Candidatus Omnitrophica bacterium]|nr:cation:proton antiporter [Candidatus Omnitrophota bacterium]